jgi:predicted Zn-dependent protease
LEAASLDDSPDELDWRARVTASEPDRPFWWSRLAEEQLEAGQIAEAEASIERAFALQPNNTRSLRIEILLALRTEDEERLVAALALMCALGSGDCDIDAAELLDEYRASIDSDV